MHCTTHTSLLTIFEPYLKANNLVSQGYKSMSSSSLRTTQYGWFCS